MYRNLIVAMKLRKITIENIAETLGIHRNSASNKVNGTTNFTIEEAFTVQRELFPDMNIDVLFEKTN